MTFRVSTYATINYNTQQNMRLSVEYAKTNQQIVSGLKSETYSGVAKDTQAIIQIDKEVSRTQTFIDRITAVEGELDTMYDTISSMIGELDILVGDVSAAISGDLLTPAELQNAAAAAYDSMIAAMNVTFQGRFLFAGANSANRPVDVTDPTYPTPFAALSAPSTNYYQGDNTVLSIQADEDYTIDYGIRADNSAFEETLRAINMLINSPATAAERDQAMSLFSSASAGLRNIQHQISTDAEKLERVKNSHEVAINHLQNRVSTLRETDVAEASTRLASIETQLEASFSTTGRILNLTILDYLR